MNIDITRLGLDSILVFEVIARLKSLKLAASELSISQPAVTHALNKLEDKLETQLCIRTRTYFALTESGAKLYNVSVNIKKQLKDYESFLRNDEDFDGIFSLSIIDNFQNENFDSAIEDIIKKFPKMRLNIQVQSAKEIQDSVLRGESDVGIGIFHNRHSLLTYKKVGEEVLQYYIAEKHPLWKQKNISKNDLKGEKVLWVDTVFRTKPDLEAQVFSSMNSKMIVKAYTNNLSCALSVLKSGEYVVPLPMGYLETSPLKFKYRALRNVKTMSLKQSIIYREDNKASTKITNAFLSLFK